MTCRGDRDRSCINPVYCGPPGCTECIIKLPGYPNPPSKAAKLIERLSEHLMVMTMGQHVNMKPRLVKR